jgi:predicted Zn-dependent protease with MMP-like domain
LKDLQIKNIVDQILIQSGSSVKVELESYFPGDRFAGGKYNFASHTITLYIEEIKDQCMQVFSSLNRFEDYLAIVFAHEIGHAEDVHLEELIVQLDASANEYSRTGIALRIEENAWDYARMLIPLTLHPFMDTIIHHSLQPYYEALEISA